MAKNQTKYSFIAEELKKRIFANEYPLDKPIPDEMTLAKEFDCSRMTMKKALEVLVLEGLLYRKRGHGTFIIKSALDMDRLNIHSQEVNGFTKLLEGRDVESKIVHFQVTFPDEYVAERLNIDLETPIYDIVRARLVDGEPYVLEYTSMPVALIPGVTQQVLEHSIYSYIREELNLKIASSYKQIRADKPTEMDFQYLDCENTDPVIEVEQTVYLNNGMAFEYSKSRHRYDKFVFTTVNIARR
ncbi:MULTISPECIES: GntR family transcriptional regulator [Listeria]|uniref:GntR family transcriptional regulator n=2 Tax=Listeria TaxID=1637 RepID=A0A099W1M4_9LIST|nr:MULTISPECIES: GntR family transcriptional regulator [Listeria]EUJ45469.1 GntR family transcriptional regulator [Listeria riparia FSL S10-1204]KGL39794.1 GntR family transcriptional regulator [Listeria booriae]MBC1227376.1 GntR family transcriptional regulator [Listeria booriae]MBC1231248.1 GntR family transcriptional regulator [Listeria booriae]MBC1235106.1 GntR family transcriptional regulator [Listeria booriae]